MIPESNVKLIFFLVLQYLCQTFTMASSKTDLFTSYCHFRHRSEMALKGLILFCFLFALHKNFLELQLQRPGCEPVEQQPTEGLGLGSVIRSLRHPGFMGLNLITRPVCIAKMNSFTAAWCSYTNSV